MGEWTKREQKAFRKLRGPDGSAVFAYMSCKVTFVVFTVWVQGFRIFEFRAHFGMESRSESGSLVGSYVSATARSHFCRHFPAVIAREPYRRHKPHRSFRSAERLTHRLPLSLNLTMQAQRRTSNSTGHPLNPTQLQWKDRSRPASWKLCSARAAEHMALPHLRPDSAFVCLRLFKHVMGM